MTKAKITSLYEMMMEESKANPMYSTILEDECLIIHRFSNGRVSEKLTERDVDNMVSGERKNFFVDAGTGSGKTTMIFEGPLPKLKEKGKKICYLVPRVSLAISIKQQLVNKDKDAMEISKMLSDYGMQKRTDFGVMDILTYQSVLQLSNKDAEEYGLIVLDEVHYFIEDAQFNRETQEQLNFILKKFKLVNKIFISATMKEIFDSLYNKCRNIEQRLPYKSSWYEFYYVERNYDYARPTFFSDINELITQIQNSTKKWLIFVDNIEKGRELQDVFNSNNEKVACFFDAKAKLDKRSAEVMSMISDESFETKVGILTCAFDVGINIKDKDIGIIIYSYTRTQFLQELGRKRIIGNEKVELFINIPDKKKLRSRMEQIKNDLKMIYEKQKYYALHPNFNGYFLEHPFYVVDGEVTYNHYTLEKLKKDYKSYECMLNTKEDSYEEGFIRTVLSWLEWSDEDIETYLSENDTTDELKKRIMDLITSTGYRIPIEEFDIFVKNLLQICDLRTDKRESRNGSTRAVNKVLKLVHYKAYKNSNDFYSIEEL